MGSTPELFDVSTPRAYMHQLAQAGVTQQSPNNRSKIRITPLPRKSRDKIRTIVRQRATGLRIRDPTNDPISKGGDKSNGI